MNLGADEKGHEETGGNSVEGHELGGGGSGAAPPPPR